MRKRRKKSFHLAMTDLSKRRDENVGVGFSEITQSYKKRFVSPVT